LVQRQLEYQADKYAANCVGADSYAETLVALNIATNGGLEKKSINYPTLSDRINNVSR
jgi:Zn-dependent protease with chaperone function